MLSLRMLILLAVIAAASISAGYALTPDSVEYPILRLVPSITLMAFAVIAGSMTGRIGKAACLAVFMSGFWVAMPSLHLIHVFGDVPVLPAFLTAVGGATIGQTIALYAFVWEERLSEARQRRRTAG
jgi:hypothetical protein